MSTWQLFSVAGNGFRWENLRTNLEGQPNIHPPSRLPSMADLLLQGCSNFLEIPSESAPMFRTGSGKSVSVKPSSVARAQSLLAADDSNIAGQVCDRDIGYSLSTCLYQTGSGKLVGKFSAGLVEAKTFLGLEEYNDNGTFPSLEDTRKPLITNHPYEGNVGYNGCNLSNSLFQTGSGKMVGISSAGLAKAKTLLGLQEDSEGCSFQSFEHTQKPSTTTEPCRLPDGYKGSSFSTPLFQTGSGKMVGISSAGLVKAKAVLGLQEVNDDQSFQSFQHKMKASTTDEPCAWHNGDNLSITLFQTGSGKKVGISPAGLVKARTLLGLQEENEDCMFSNAEHARMQSTTNDACRWRDNECSSLDCSTALMESKLCNRDIQSFNQPKKCNPAPKPSPIKFHTAGGRSISVSTDALHRARSLLGDPELGSFLNEGDSGDIPFSISKERRCLNDTLSNKKDDIHAPIYPKKVAKRKHGMQTFISPVRLSSEHVHSSSKLKNTDSGSNLMKKFDAVDCSSDGSLDSDIPCRKKPLSSSSCTPKIGTKQSLPNGIASIINSPRMSSGGPLVDISNTIGTGYINDIPITTDKKRLGRRNSVSPFKRPRSSKFSTPMKSGVSSVPNGLSTLSSRRPSCNRRVFARYPFQEQRMYLKEFFGLPPSNQNMLEHLSDQVKQMNYAVSEKYMFPDERGSNSIGPDAFRHMLIQSGASVQYASREWVMNHYKWIVWKLVCYERCYPARSDGKFLTVSNVLEELKYRYEREVNLGQRSAIKRILEGDASPSSMLVLCISAIHSISETNIETHCVTVNGTENSNTIRVELTDGWYSVHGLLDALLLKLLADGKLFVGQKLRIWGATLCGWVGPVSPLEASRTISLLLHMNGTYRAHWADKLGFCKNVGVPLAFRLIKSNGGTVPRTIVGVTRIYPLLYKEKLSGGGSIVRSERMESQMMQLFNQRCSLVVEGVISECQRGFNGPHVYNDSDSEGANILKLLETTAEPEVLMADMTSEQLNTFASYQAKQEAMRQFEMEKLIEKALEDAGLTTREVTAFMRVRVVGLTNKTYQGKSCIKEGIITIWSPTEKQKNELVEGQAYVFSGLTPVNSDSDTLYLQARGSTTRWQSLSPLAVKNFKPFFSPRKSVILSDLGDVPLSSEFDIAAYVVYVGEAYTAANQKKQWVFVADSSTELQSEESSNSLLAISFCSTSTTDSFLPVNLNLVGSTVGFCNLIKRAKDQMNQLWVAEGTENSTYFTNFDSTLCSHLKHAACCAERWAKASNSTIQKLKENILFIIGDSK